MSNLLFKDKYLKSKENYLNLLITKQEGGIIYDSGKYIFFIPSNNTNEIDNLIDKNNNLTSSFNHFTDKIGKESKFLRIGTTKTGIDINNTYNYIYPNQGIIAIQNRRNTNLYANIKNINNGINVKTTLAAFSIRDIENIKNIGNDTDYNVIKTKIEEYLKIIYDSINPTDIKYYKSGRVLIIDTGLISTNVLKDYDYEINYKSKEYIVKLNEHKKNIQIKSS